jgi:3'-phosphoadenosine 5'-phosphosulfate sulfotransferase
MGSRILRKEGAVGERKVSLSDLQLQILRTVKHYTRLTVRQLYYVLTSRCGFPASHRFYKILNYHLTKMRRLDPRLNVKFVDPTRHFVAAPRPYSEVELWVEKETIRTLLEKLAAKYRLSIQVLRGFASLSMFRKALRRANERGVKKILYIGDFDASGLLIDKIAQREMQTNMTRIALTLEQTRKYRLPSLPVNMKDSRADEYVAKYGSRSWEIESLRPRTFLRIVEKHFRENVPEDFLAEASTRDTAAKMAAPLVNRFKARLEQDALRMLKTGKQAPEILAGLQARYGIKM